MKKYALAVLVAASLVAPAYAQGTKPSGTTMAIKGEGQYAIKPDYATISLTIATRALTSQEATDLHASLIAHGKNVLKDLEKLGVRVETSNFRLRTEQRTETVQDRNGFTGTRPVGKPEFVAVTNYEIAAQKTDVLSEVVSRLADSEVFEMGSVRFKLDNPRNALLQARKAAVADARAQAEAYAEAANVKLVEVAEITDGEASRGDAAYDLPSRRAGAGGGTEISEIIPPATLNYTASVNMIWRISSRR